MNYNHEIMQLIVHSSNAKEFYLKAIRSARIGKWEKVRKLIRSGKESLTKAQNVNEQLFNEEKEGQNIDLTFVMIHARSQVDNAIVVQELATEIIENLQMLGELEQEMKQLKGVNGQQVQKGQFIS